MPGHHLCKNHTSDTSELVLLYYSFCFVFVFNGIIGDKNDILMMIIVTVKRKKCDMCL